MDKVNATDKNLEETSCFYSEEDSNSKFKKNKMSQRRQQKSSKEVAKNLEKVALNKGSANFGFSESVNATPGMSEKFYKKGNRANN